MGATEEKMEAESNVRRWAGWLLGAAVTLQFYFVQELLAALALFAIGFAAVASVIVGLYSLQKGWEKAVLRIFGFDQVAARSLPARDFRLNGQAVERSKLSQELKTRNRNNTVTSDVSSPLFANGLSQYRANHSLGLGIHRNGISRSPARLIPRYSRKSRTLSPLMPRTRFESFIVLSARCPDGVLRQ